MTEIVRFNTTDNIAVLVEVDEQAFGVESVARDHDGVIVATKRLEEALGSARAMAKAALRAFEGVGFEELALEFGVKLSAETGLALIAKASGEANLKITAKWGRSAKGSLITGSEEK